MSTPADRPGDSATMPSIDVGAPPRERRHVSTAIFSNLAEILILAAVPASVFWFPLVELDEIGRITVSDFVLACLWIVSIACLPVPRYRSWHQKVGLRIIAFTVVIGILATVGALISPYGRDALFQFSFHMKRFGLASILPLALALFGTPRLFRRLRYVLLVVLLAMAAFSVFPAWRQRLPIVEDVPPMSTPVRAIGMISNPNDMGYLAVGIFALFVALFAAFPVARSRRISIVTLGSAAAMVCIVMSGSRSAVLGLLVGTAYYLFKTPRGVIHKVSILLLLSLVAFVGMQSSDVFRERVSAAYSQRLQERNIDGRLQAQWIAIRATIENPFGIGFTNFGDATTRLSIGSSFTSVEGSDSIYIDTLLGAGVLGLVTLLMLFRTCWKFIQRSPPGKFFASKALASGVVAMFTIGMAAVAPASVFVASLFFLMVGSGYGIYLLEGPDGIQGDARQV